MRASVLLLGAISSERQMVTTTWKYVSGLRCQTWWKLLQRFESNITFSIFKMAATAIFVYVQISQLSPHFDSTGPTFLSKLVKKVRKVQRLKLLSFVNMAGSNLFAFCDKSNPTMLPNYRYNASQFSVKYGGNRLNGFTLRVSFLNRRWRPPPSWISFHSISLYPSTA